MWRSLAATSINDGKPLQRMTCRRSIEDEIPAPNMVHTLCSQTVTSMLGLAFSPLFLLFLTHFQSFGFPDPMHSFEAHPKTFQAKQPCHLAIAEPRTLPG